MGVGTATKSGKRGPSRGGAFVSVQEEGNVNIS